MELKHFVLALDGNVQSLSTILEGKEDILVRSIILQPRGTNANVIYIGASSDIDSEDYGWRLEAADGGIPPAPFITAEISPGAFRLRDIYALGTSGEFLHIGIITW